MQHILNLPFFFFVKKSNHLLKKSSLIKHMLFWLMHNRYFKFQQKTITRHCISSLKKKNNKQTNKQKQTKTKPATLT